MACCSMCHSKFLTLSLLRNHLERYHKAEENFHVVCQSPECENVYNNFEGFKSHLRRKHAKVLHSIIDAGGANSFPANNENAPQDAYMRAVNDNDPVIDAIEPIGNANEPNDNEIDNIELDIENHNVINHNHDGAVNVETIRKLNASYLLETKELHKLTQKSVDAIVTSTTSTVKNSLKLVRCRVLSILNDTHNEGNEAASIPEIREFLDSLLVEETLVTNPYLGMETKWQQDNVFRDLFGVVVRFVIVIKFCTNTIIELVKGLPR